MKRKKLKLCNRPLLDLKKGDPKRAIFEKLNEGWATVTDPEGDVLHMTSSHVKSREFVESIDPEVLKMKLNPTGTTVCMTSYDVPAGGYSIAMAVSWFAPDHDDPERLESGWSVAYFKGPISRRKELLTKIQAVVRHTLARSLTDHYL